MLLRDAADLDSFAFLDDSQAGAAYVAFAARGGEAPRVLVIGAGGGIDVMIALAHGASSVTAVEINRAMIDVVADHFDGYLGGLFHGAPTPSPSASIWSMAKAARSCARAPSATT